MVPSTDRHYGIQSRNDFLCDSRKFKAHNDNHFHLNKWKSLQNIKALFTNEIKVWSSCEAELEFKMCLNKKDLTNYYKSKRLCSEEEKNIKLLWLSGIADSISVVVSLLLITRII